MSISDSEGDILPSSRIHGSFQFCIMPGTKIQSSHNIFKIKALVAWSKAGIPLRTLSRIYSHSMYMLVANTIKKYDFAVIYYVKNYIMKRKNYFMMQRKASWKLLNHQGWISLYLFFSNCHTEELGFPTTNPSEQLLC